MKNWIFLACFIVCQSAMADSASLAKKDGTSLEAIEKALLRDGRDKEYKVTDYSKSWNAYNPYTKIVDPDGTYRLLSFEIKGYDGKMHNFTCKAHVNGKETGMTIYDCVNANVHDFPFWRFTRASDYGHTDNRTYLVDVFNRPPSPSSTSKSETDSVR